MQPSPTRDVNVRSTVPLISPIDLVKQLPITSAVEDTVLEGRSQIQEVLRGDDPRLLMVVGPCSIHDEKAALEYAERLSKLSKKLTDRLLIVMRVYFEKPRTNVGWKGLINDPHLDDTFDVAAGLYSARSLLLQIGEMGVYAGTEFLDPIVPQYLADMVSWATIGARTTESQTHRQLSSGLSMPVGFKNGTDGSAQVAVDAMIAARAPNAFLGIDHYGQTCVVHTRGNADGHLVLRGGRSGPNFGAKAIADAQKLLNEAGVRSQLLVDCSHGNSNKDHTRQAVALRDVVEQRMAGNADIIGCMIESNLNSGSQKLNGDSSTLKYGVSITDACIGWDETEELLTWAYDKVDSPAVMSEAGVA
ncbi:MAG: 3-deoxy-7-phosphoheptulonate synthase [Chloroflexi bacterium]|nr:3-deoxy-7-phosphoheptulonate synthase [Chloroflexota bacterium]